MDIGKQINPHCETPALVEEGARWYIRFKYRDHEGKRKAKKVTGELNNDKYVRLVNGRYVEENKKARKKAASDSLDEVKLLLCTKYFNAAIGKFESLDKSETKFVDYLDKYLCHTPSKERRASTTKLYTSYNNIIKQYLKHNKTEAITLKEVDREFIERFLNKVRSEHSASQRDNYYVYLNGVFKYCVDDLEVLDKNPLRKLHKINKKETQSNRRYDNETLDLVLAESRNLDVYFWLFLRLMLYSLRRPSELLKIQYKDFNFKKGILSFDSSIIKTNKKLYTELKPEFLMELKALIPADVQPSDYLFGSFQESAKASHRTKALFAPYTTPFHHFQDKFKTISKRLQLPKGFTIYSMKHTSASQLKELGWSDDDIITYTGHTNTSILGRYTREAILPRREDPRTF
ncbi:MULTISPECIES: site-specific integrase [unclassified Pedobacter]|uniref:tyrosine-type recombinase/integrase n=1 Tax=unclassified Pedobacter TaxID=2628915 RepID=UPI001D67C6F5|nr:MULTISPECIES: site-specific integrase [unclassified Pedobacter]CAH0185708.1 hypothetical protein SRABI36_01622 [Pedobacter sp. Bi36]CAH0241513.1 hypothetical protein SRABI126_02715 [Pedobacter sp. Bi126]